MSTLAAPCLETKNLWFGYHPDAPVLKGISLAVPEGEFAAVIGENGSGKTTLSKHFNGLLRPAAGEVRLFGTNIRGLSIGELSHTVGYVFQNPDHQIFSADTWEEIAFGPRNLGLNAGEVRRRTEAALEAFHLTRYARRQPAALSYGLRRKISIAAVMAMRPKVLILDEPTTGLDWKNVTELMELLGETHRQGTTILLITHDLRLVADYIPRALLIHAGELAAYGDTRKLIPTLRDLGNFQASIPQITRLAGRLAPLGFRADTLTVEEFCEQYEARE